MTEPNTAQDAVVIERTFDAPVDLVWRMWTEPEHFTQWYGPEGVTVTVVTMDVRVGGSRLVGMEMGPPEGRMQMWFAGEYLDVVECERLLYTEFISDPDGNPAADSVAAAGHPTTTEVRVEFEEVGDRTRMVVTHRGIPSDSPGATGWTMAFHKLASHLAALPGR